MVYDPAEEFECNPNPELYKSKVPVRLTPHAREAFLQNLAKTGLFQKSAIAAGVSASAVRNKMKNCEEFAALVDEAREDYRELISETIHNRAIHGVQEDVYWQGEAVGKKTVYSDSLLLAHAKRHIPEYRDKSTVNVNAKSGVLVVPTQTMPVEDWENQYGGVTEENEDESTG